jgi:hypothetical protein
MRSAITVAYTSVPVVVRNGQGREVLGEPLAEDVVVLVRLEVGEVDTGVAGHAGVQVGHEHGEVEVGVASVHGAAEEVAVLLPGGGRFQVQAVHVERAGGELENNLKGTAIKMHTMIKSTSLLKEAAMDE